MNQGTESNGNYEGTAGVCLDDSCDDDGLDEESGDPLGPYYNGCLATPDPNAQYPGVRHQCEGHFSVILRFDAVNLPSWADDWEGPKEIFDFEQFGQGLPDDSYEKPRVMSCCNPIGNEIDEPWGDPHLTWCYQDMVEQGCRSLYSRILMIKKEDGFPSVANGIVNDLADWAADNTQACYDAFWTNSSNFEYWPPQFAPPNGTLPEPFNDVTWNLPSSAENDYIENIELEIRTPWITGVWLPEDSDDWLECSSQKENNKVEFLDHDPDSGDLVLLSDGTASIEGPDRGSGPAYGEGDLASTATSCKLCSFMTIDTGSEMLNALVLDGDSFVDVSGYGDTVRVGSYRIALFHPVRAAKIGLDVYRVAAGEAMFRVAAEAESASWALTGYNVDGFDIQWSSSTSSWIFEEFEIDYDGEWTITAEELNFGD